MSYSPEPSVISDCDCDTVMSYSVEDELEDSKYDPQMFEKPRGERRWLGKHHHRGKELFHAEVKDRTFIEKTISSTEPLSKRATERIGASTRDGLELNVVYSLDKKKRWQDADNITLLGSAPENVNSEVVEKNSLKQAGFHDSNKSTFAVHQRKVNLDAAPGEFEVRSATSTSAHGQHYTNFLPTNREISKKANARMMTIRGDEPKEDVTPQPTVSYNIYKTHKSPQVVGNQLYIGRTVSKSGHHRANKKVDMEMYDDVEDYSDEEEAEDVDQLHRRMDTVMDLSSFVVEKEKQNNRRSKRNDSELSYDIIDPKEVELESEYTHLIDIQSYLKREGFMFEEADVTFQSQNENFEEQINMLREEKGLIVKELKPNQYSIDCSDWCNMAGLVKLGEATTVVVITHLKKNTYHVVVNSTIVNHPSKRGPDNLRKQISTAATLKEAIGRITIEISSSRKVIESMKLSSSFYGRKNLSETLNNVDEWDNQGLQMRWPHKYNHSTWANSQELSNMGGKLEWKDLCEMVKKDSQTTVRPTSSEICGVCGKKKSAHLLYAVQNDSKVACTECLRDQFYRELRAKRLPIDLQTETADELEYLPTFIPLTVLNLYIRMVAEMIYKDLGATGDFEKCPSCKSAVYFEEPADGKEKKAQNRSCPCGYSWCKHCDKPPHWPMECGDFAEWEEKWFLRYSMMNAQGTGTKQLLIVTCSCQKEIYNVLHPENYIQCPKCAIKIRTSDSTVVWTDYYYPYRPRYRKLVKQGVIKMEREYVGRSFNMSNAIYIDIAKIPPIKASVMEACGAARDVRYNDVAHKKTTDRESNLIRKKILASEEVENLFGTSAYLAETVTAWMHVKNQYDRDVKFALENLMEHRKSVEELLNGEDGDAIREGMKKMRKEIDMVVEIVEKRKDKMDNNKKND